MAVSRRARGATRLRRAPVAAAVGLAAGTLGLALLVAVPGTAQAAPGSWTQAQVNTSTQNGVAYIDTQQNLNGSFGSTAPIAETGMALVAYSVLANGNFSNLSPSYQTHVQNAITWLLSQQNVDGSWGDSGFFFTYGTGIVLAGLSSFQGVNASVPTAITSGRNFLIGEFQGPAYTGCNSSDVSSTAYFCGGWNYDTGTGRSDESNTGFAMFGLRLTGGMPASLIPDNINWQHHVQTISSNPFSGTGPNDGGGSYQPGCAAQNCSDFSSNANDTGSMLFGLGYDGVAASDAHVVAGLKLGQDVLDEYELSLPTANMVYHSGASEDGTCTIGSLGCDWNFAGSEGGYHYSIFALTKGLGEYIAPDLTNASNWYAKVVDLLLTQQNVDGSWPQDGRDDASTLFATALSVAALGLVAVPKPASGSQVHAVIQVSTSPSFAGDPVYISSSQLQASCRGSITFETLQGGSTTAPRTSTNFITVILDDDGNATVVVDGSDCAAGTDIVESDLTVAPFLTALTTLHVLPPQVTPEGVSGSPANEVETGNSPSSGDSFVYTVFTVETNPVYAEQTVEISSPQLQSRCLKGWRWEPSNGTAIDQASGLTVASGIIDDDGNATFVFKGESCASGPSSVIADVLAGSHPTYVTTYTVAPPHASFAGAMMAASKHHHHHHGGGGTGGPPPPPMTVSASPNPLVETG